MRYVEEKNLRRIKSERKYFKNCVVFSFDREQSPSPRNRSDSSDSKRVYSAVSSYFFLCGSLNFRRIVYVFVEGIDQIEIAIINFRAENYQSQSQSAAMLKMWKN